MGSGSPHHACGYAACATSDSSAAPTQSWKRRRPRHKCARLLAKTGEKCLAESPLFAVGQLLRLQAATAAGVTVSTAPHTRRASATVGGAPTLAQRCRSLRLRLRREEQPCDSQGRARQPIPVQLQSEAENQKSAQEQSLRIRPVHSKTAKGAAPATASVHATRQLRLRAASNAKAERTRRATAAVMRLFALSLRTALACPA